MESGEGLELWTPDIRSETRPDGSILVWNEEPLAPYPRCITERFMHWARTTPERVWMAERGSDHRLIEITYGEAAEKVRSIGSALLSYDLSEDRPLLILSGNSIAHALMALGAQHVGVPSAALAPAYSTTGGSYLKLRDVVAQMTPGMIFAERVEAFAPAIEAVIEDDVPVVSVEGALEGRSSLSFHDLAATDATPAMEKAHAAVGPDTVAKFLFTSGTTGSPKAVIQTQRMICSNPQMDAHCYLFMEHEPPVVVDWAPWNHTASGNRVFNLVIYFGGTYYIDDGRPTPRDIGRTIENLREVSPTWYFNVPLGYQMLLDAMETDDVLRDRFFARLKMLFYAGAGMGQAVWERLTRVADEMVPGGVPLCTGFGATETGPSTLLWHRREAAAGNLGVPLPGVVFKLVPNGEKLEGRVKGPAVTPGYWRNPEMTAAAFDEEGYYMFGDAFRFVEEGNPGAGFYFDGRLAENFKLASGTWVAVGPLRAALTNDLKGLATDTVIAGEGRTELGALVVPDWSALAAVAGERDLPPDALLGHPKVRSATMERLAEHASRATGSSTRVTRLRFIDTPLSFDLGEITDKGSINQRALLRNRAELVESLWSDHPGVIALGTLRATGDGAKRHE